MLLVRPTKNEVATDVMRPEDVPGCTPSLEDCSKEQSAQGHNFRTAIYGTLWSAMWKAQFFGRGRVASGTATTVYSAVRIALS